jgi:hypothetical protein
MDKVKICTPLIGLLLLTSVAITAQSRKTALPSSLVEISGLATLPDGTLWALADSGNDPNLYQIDPQHGAIIETRRLPLRNRDWEELAPAPDGTLWIGDFGNNRNMRRDLTIYQYDPKTDRVLDSIRFVYPDQTAFPPANEADMRFDCEAMVWYNDSLHLFTKSRFRSGYQCSQYTLPARSGRYVAQLCGTVVFPKRVVTGAAMSADGKTLALTAYYVKKRRFLPPYTRASVIYLTDYQGSNFLLTGTQQMRRLPKVLVARQYESITQRPNGHWYAANEGIMWQKPRLWRVRKP